MDNPFKKYGKGESTKSVDTLFRVMADGAMKVVDQEDIRGPQGEKGDQGESIEGPRGELGDQGIKGDKGDRGDRGLQGESIRGEKGDKGDPGKDGRDGKDGADGNGIENIAIEGRDLLVTLKDGDIKNLGPVVGKDGGKGGGAIFGLSVQDDGAAVGTGILSLNFTGSGVSSITKNGRQVDVDISGGGSGSPGGSQYDVQLNDGAGGFAGSNDLNFQGGYLTINGDSGYGQLQFLNTPASAGYGGAGINGADGEIIPGAADGDLSIWASQSISFGGNTGNAIQLGIDGATGKINIPQLTVSELVATDASHNLQSLDTATYPSLTELSYVKGVTSALQTQINAKGSGTVTSVTGTTNRITSSGGTTPAIDIAATYVGQSSITTLGTIATGVWQGTKIGLAYGGTNADLSATGGTSQVLKQATTGAAVTVGTLSASDVGLGNVTNDAQTKAAIVPNTAPTSGQVLAGNAGSTAYAPVSVSGAFTLASTGAATIATPGTLTVSSSNSTATAHTHAITSSSAPGAAASILATDSSGIIGNTGTRLVKGWFTDLEVTNAPTSGGVAIPTISSTSTLTNKRITRRLVSVTQSATPAINTDNMDIASITGLAQAITSMTSSLTGTPVAGDYLMIQIMDNGTARAITWGASFASTTVTLPTTTVISTLLRIGFQWSGSVWQCIATC